MANGKTLKDVKVEDTFETSLDENGRQAGETKTTHAVFDFDGVTEDTLLGLAVASARIKVQARLRKVWNEVPAEQTVTYKVTDLLSRMRVQRVTMDSAAEFVANLSPEDQKAFLKKAGLTS